MKVLVLGTVHFGESSDFRRWDARRPSMGTFDTLLNTLTAFKPEAIFVEYPAPSELALSSQVSENSRRIFSLSEEIRKELGIDWYGAREKARHLLRDGEFGQAIPYLLAFYDVPSALLNWKRLTPDERESLPRKVAEYLESVSNPSDEMNLIAIPLALKLNHTHLYGMDAMVEDVPPALVDELNALFNRLNEEGRFRQLNDTFEEIKAVFLKSLEKDDLLEFYRYINSRQVLESIEKQWDILSRFGGKLGSMKVRSWLAQNIRMASHILENMAHLSADRALVLVGASHNLPLERILTAAGVEVIHGVP